DYTSNSPLTTVESQQIKEAAELEASRPYPVYGDFNNILIFNRKENSFTTIFNQRIAISEFQMGWRTAQDMLIITASDADSDHNGELGYGDLRSIFIYTFADKQMHQISTPGMSAGDVIDIPNADYLIIRYDVDRNHDGKIGTAYSETGAEPS